MSCARNIGRIHIVVPYELHIFGVHGETSGNLPIWRWQCVS